MFSWCDTMSYICPTISYVDIRYRINILYRRSNIVGPVTLYRIYDIVYTIKNTTSNTVRTISYVCTYDIIRDVQYRMWQESRCTSIYKYIKVHTYYSPTTVTSTPGFLPHTILYVTYDIVCTDVRYRTYGVGCRMLYRIYDIVYAI